MSAIMSMFTVYKNPTDHPGWFVVRRFEIEAGKVSPCELVAKETTLEAVREKIPEDLYRMDRQPNDDPKIVEVWL